MSLSPTETITFVIGVVMCILGICTFVVGMLSRAKQDGALNAKVDNAIQGIAEIQATLKDQRNWREDIGVRIGEITKELEFMNHEIKELKQAINS